MFTGIIEEIGEVVRVQQHGDAARLTVRGPLVVEGARHGDSISVSGVCLTAVDLGREEFTADVMRETLDSSTLDRAKIGTAVNLERAAQLGARLGGHIVQGHVDGTAVVLSTHDGSAWRVVRMSLTPELAPLVAHKGSIAVDGTSLTVSAVGGDPLDDGYWFEVSLIPETLAATTLGTLASGDRVNIETDILARQVERALSFRRGSNDTAQRWTDALATAPAAADRATDPVAPAERAHA